jgi:hypothetical protein
MEIIFSSWAEFIQLAQSTKQTGPLLFPSLPQLPNGPHASGVSFPQISLPRVRRCATGILPLKRRSVACRCCCSAPSPVHVSLHHLVPSRGRAVISPCCVGAHATAAITAKPPRFPGMTRSPTSCVQRSSLALMLLSCMSHLAAEPSAHPRVGRLLARRVAAST